MGRGAAFRQRRRLLLPPRRRPAMKFDCWNAPSNTAKVRYRVRSREESSRSRTPHRNPSWSEAPLRQPRDNRASATVTANPAAFVTLNPVRSAADPLPNSIEVFNLTLGVPLTEFALGDLRGDRFDADRCLQFEGPNHRGAAVPICLVQSRAVGDRRAAVRDQGLNNNRVFS